MRRRGVRVDRLPALRYEPIARERIRDAIGRFGPYDVLLLTSREAVRVMSAAGVLPTRGARRSPVRVVCGGPATARALAEVGVRGRWSPPGGVGGAVVESLKASAPLRIVYPRSDRAGNGLGRRLTGDGHHVLDLVAYRVRSRIGRDPSLASRVARSDRVLVTSPSAISFLRAALGPPGFRRLRRSGRVVVLGERSARSARGHGIRGVRVVPGITDSEVQSFLTKELAVER